MLGTNLRSSGTVGSTLTSKLSLQAQIVFFKMYFVCVLPAHMLVYHVGAGRGPKVGSVCQNPWDES